MQNCAACIGEADYRDYSGGAIRCTCEEPIVIDSMAAHAVPIGGGWSFYHNDCLHLMLRHGESPVIREALEYEVVPPEGAECPYCDGYFDERVGHA
jgi:hypothetical protein